MSDTAWYVVVVLVALLLIGLAWWYFTRRRTEGGPAAGWDVRMASAAPGVGVAAPVVDAPPAVATMPDADTLPMIATTGNVRVTAVHHGTADGDAGEWVMLVSEDYQPIQLAGWRLTDEGAKHSFVFPSYTLEPDGRLRIHMARGEDSAGDLYVGSNVRWWNNAGDCAYLYDAGGELVNTHCYGTSAATI